MSKKGGGVKAHQYAEIFPLLDDSELTELADDIKAHGLRDPIWLYQGQVLDGRNRLTACQMVGVDPEFREFEGDDAAALEFVVSLNVHRRHLTVAQRAFAVAEIAKLEKGRPSKNASPDAFSQTKAAERLHVSRSSAQRTKKILDRGSDELIEAAKSGEVGLEKAAAVVSLPKEQQLEAAKAPPPPKPKAAEPPPEAAPEPRPAPQTVEEISKAVAAADASVDGEESDEEGWDAMTAEEQASAEREYVESVNKVMEADDKMSAAHQQIKQLTAQVAALQASITSHVNGQQAAIAIVKERDKTIRAQGKKLNQQAARIKELEDENKELKATVSRVTAPPGAPRKREII